MALVAASTIAGDAPKCTGAARECEQKIRQLVSGRRYFGATVLDKNPGLVVSNVKPDSPAAKTGLKPGDILISMNGKSLTHASVREFKQYIADARSTGRIFLLYMRHGTLTRIDTRLEPYTKEQVAKMVAAHLAQTHTTTAGAQR
ncbi:MAG TPA: PDZ domain-containing protein [Thermoanaerobaculia bacterium]|nr:PDZ domain-containing protein [Thermoanaerobaculia bacterium]